MRKEEKIKAALLIFGMAEVKRFESLPNIPEPRSEKYLAAREELLSMHFGETQRIWTPKRAVAAILVAIFLLAVTACAAIEPIREFFVEVFDSFIKVEIEDPEAPGADEEIYPETIEQAYGIANIPNDFILTDNTRAPETTMTVWINPDSAMIIFIQNTIKGNNITMDGDNVEYEEIIIEGRNVFKHHGNGLYTLLWKEHGYLFSISCSDTIPWETVVDMVTGLAPENE